MQSEINLLDFQDAEPDILVHSTPAIVDRFNQRFDVALKALCKKKGLDAEVMEISKYSPFKIFSLWLLDLAKQWDVMFEWWNMQI